MNIRVQNFEWKMYPFFETKRKKKFTEVRELRHRHLIKHYKSLRISEQALNTFHQEKDVWPRSRGETDTSP